MALTSCPECGHQISEAATTCPNCGHPVKAPGQPTQPGWYKDPSGRQTHEAYWDGEKWTGETRQSTGGPSASPNEPARWVLVGAGALLALGSFLPWAQAGIFSLPGTRGDGVLTLIAGVFMLMIAFIKRSSVIPGLAAFGLSLFSLWIVANVFSNFADTPDAIGAGLLVTGLGGIVGLFGGVRAWNHRTN